MPAVDVVGKKKTKGKKIEERRGKIKITARWAFSGRFTFMVPILLDRIYQSSCGTVKAFCGRDLLEKIGRAHV